MTASDTCIGQLQTAAIDKSKTLQAIDQRIEVINTKIEEARKNNQKTIVLRGRTPGAELSEAGGCDCAAGAATL
jgi:hypothetical protein